MLLVDGLFGLTSNLSAFCQFNCYTVFIIKGLLTFLLFCISGEENVLKLLFVVALFSKAIHNVPKSIECNAIAVYLTFAEDLLL